MLSIICMLGSCRQASKYADDAIKYVDDYADDVIKGKKNLGIKKAPREKICNSCHGSGRVYDAYGFIYQCSNCGGDGKVWFN